MLTLRTHLVFLLSVALSSALFTGCSSEEGPAGADSSDATDPADTTDPSDSSDAADSADATDPSDGGPSTCSDPEGFQARIAELQAAFEAITLGVDEYPVGVSLPEATNGTLEITLNPNAFPVVFDDRGVFAAASKLGAGRVVAFSGQDFISSGDRSTLLGVGDVDTLLTNAAGWASQVDNLAEANVLAANDAVANILLSGAFTQVAVADAFLPNGLWEVRDWSAENLAGKDLAVVQVNEWGTLHLDPVDIANLRTFVENGGGLIIAGSALHWSWWLSDSASDFPANLLLEGTGIRWNANDVPDLSDARSTFDPLSPPDALWCAYIAGEELDASQLARLPGVFDAALEMGRTAEVDEALTRLILDTSSLPVAANSPEARLSANVAASLGPHPWPLAHPWTSTFPGRPDADLETKSGASVVDASWSGNRPLGYYAPPGMPVTISIPAAWLDRGLSIQVGERYDDLRNLNHIENWYRAPMMLRTFDITSETTQVTHTFGGALYLVVPQDNTGTIDVEISGAYPMTVYTQGSSTGADWDAVQNIGVPQTILQELGHVRLVVETSAAQTVTDPSSVVDFWSQFHSHHIELAQEPQTRRYESHWIFDTQVGWGYANATDRRITYPKLSEVWALRTQTGNEDWWLFGHELGHQFQTSDWTSGDVTEVCVNLFTMYTLNKYIHGGGNFETIGFQDGTLSHAELESYRWATADLFGKLQLYRQLVFEFGWENMQAVFASYYQAQYPRAEYGSFMDGFAIRMSAITERNLADFFEHWEYPMSAEAGQTIRNMGHATWMPPGW